MPTYPNLPTIKLAHFPEGAIRQLHAHLDIESLLDVGAGHGGVHDYGYWDSNLRLLVREACDIHWIRALGSSWVAKVGVDVHKLTDHYAPKSFDLVQCFEVLEHVKDPRLALEQLCAVANKMVIITSADEIHHMGEEQEAIEKINPHQRYIKQPSVDDLLALGFRVMVDEESCRQLVAFKEIV